MKILLGICGFGNGHTAREADVLRELLARGHDVALLVFLNSKRYAERHFPDVPAYEIRVPIIHMGRQGIDFARSAAEPYNRFDDGNRLNFQAMADVLGYFGGPPDLVISDYELVAAQLAYAMDVPLITIDQQSKFAAYQLPDINGFSRLQEKSRLSMFFPRAEARYACSFFQLPWELDPSYPITLIPPILRHEIYEVTPSQADKPLVTVYFSPHVPLPQSNEAIVNVFRKLPDVEFAIFQKQAEPPRDNLRFYGFDSANFIDHVARSHAIVTTAGHNLLSELMLLGKPVYTIPAQIFDQQFCAYIIEKNGLGVRAESVDERLLGDFLDQLPSYQANIAARRGLVEDFNGLQVLIDYLSADFKI